MENMEKITWRIWESDGLGKALLIGGALLYIPLINFLVLGYFGCWARKLILKKGMDLPEWQDGNSIVRELARVIVPFAGWVMLPVGLAWLFKWALTGILTGLHLGYFWSFAYLPLLPVALLSPPALVVSLIRFYATNDLREAFDIPDIIREVIGNLRRCLFPLFQFYGIIAFGLPLVGFAVFLATLPLLAQLVLVFRNADEDLKTPEY
jgi:hypothetical protein